MQRPTQAMPPSMRRPVRPSSTEEVTRGRSIAGSATSGPRRRTRGWLDCRAVCGIAGILAYRGGARVGERELGILCDAQRHRGPDDAGAWISADGRVGLGHRRLSIIDLSPLGHQPMSTPDEALRIVFNGEIYNFRALRAELEASGCRFVSTSDTEVLLHGYRTWGLGLLDRLR